MKKKDTTKKSFFKVPAAMKGAQESISPAYFMADLSLICGVLLAVALQATSGVAFFDSEYESFVFYHFTSIAVVSSSIFLRSLISRRTPTTESLVAFAVWALCPLAGPALSFVVYINGQKYKQRRSRLHGYLFKRTHSPDSLPLVDRLAALLKRMPSLLKSPPIAYRLLNRPGHATEKIEMLSDFTDIPNEDSSRIFKIAKDDETYDVRVYAFRKLQEEEKRRLDSIQTRIRWLEIDPDNLDLARETLFQCISMFRAKLSSGLVSMIWLEKTYSLVAKVDWSDEQILVLLGRAAIILKRVDEAETYLRLAMRSGALLSSYFYQAELHCLKGEYGSTKSIMSDIWNTRKTEIPETMVERVKYWAV